MLVRWTIPRRGGKYENGKQKKQEEIAAIFAVLGQSTMTDSRNTAIMALLLDSGLRLSELAGHYSLALPSLGGNDIFHTGLPD